MRVALLLWTAAAVCCCRPSGEIDPRSEVIVSVRGRYEFTFTRAEIEASIAKSQLDEQRKIGAADEAWVEAHIEGMIEERILLEEAKLRGVKTSTRAVQAAAAVLLEGAGPVAQSHYQSSVTLQDRLKQNMMVATLLAQEIPDKPLDEESLLASYEALSDEQRERPPMLHALHILVEAKADAIELRRAIESGQSFSEAARQKSIAPESAGGGDLGWFNPEEYPPVFRACQSLPVGALSPVVPSTSGYHLFKLIGRKPGHILDLDELRPQLQAEARAEQARAFKRKLRASVEVEIKSPLPAR